jgi:hypothetical protein
MRGSLTDKLPCENERTDAPGSTFGHKEIRYRRRGSGIHWPARIVLGPEEINLIADKEQQKQSPLTVKMSSFRSLPPGTESRFLNPKITEVLSENNDRNILAEVIAIVSLSNIFHFDLMCSGGCESQPINNYARGAIYFDRANSFS